MVLSTYRTRHPAVNDHVKISALFCLSFLAVVWQNILKIVRLGAGDALDFGSPAVLGLEIFSG
jgi:hypothetical protein